MNATTRDLYQMSDDDFMKKYSGKDEYMQDIVCDQMSSKEFKQSFVGLQKQNKLENSSNLGVTIGVIMMVFMLASNLFYNLNLSNVIW